MLDYNPSQRPHPSVPLLVLSNAVLVLVIDAKQRGPIDDAMVEHEHEQSR